MGVYSQVLNLVPQKSMKVTPSHTQFSKPGTRKTELTDTAIKNAKPKDKQWKLSDRKGLFVLVHPNGAKYWRMKYRFAGKEKTLSFGIYPDVSLKKARESRDEARKLISNGVDPGSIKKQTKQTTKEPTKNNFDSIVREWLAKRSQSWSELHVIKITRLFERDLFPWLGGRPIADITAPELLAVVRRIEDRGAVHTAHRALSNCGSVFRYAISTQRASRDPSNDLRGALSPMKSESFATITDPQEVGQLLRAIESYRGTFITRTALKLSPMLFVRPGELRKAEWSEFDLEKCEWRIPEIKMKRRRVHIVPLPSQAIEILKELYPLSGSGRHLFPSSKYKDRPISESAVLGAIRRLGYERGQMTAHGFRHMASTILNEQGWSSDAIERQLAHVEGNKVRAAYNHAQYLDERRKMMQHWADYLDSLKEGASVVSLFKKSS